MIRLRRQPYPEDVTLIQQAVWYHGKLDCTRQQAADLWHLYSDSVSAGWIMLDSGDAFTVWLCVQPFIDVEDE